MKKFCWIYPRNNVGNLDRCQIFYGTEAAYRSWLNAGQKPSRSLLALINRMIKFSLKLEKAK